jgi:hypothetical protein
VATGKASDSRPAGQKPCLSFVVPGTSFPLHIEFTSLLLCRLGSFSEYSIRSTRAVQNYVANLWNGRLLRCKWIFVTFELDFVILFQIRSRDTSCWLRPDGRCGSRTSKWCDGGLHRKQVCCLRSSATTTCRRGWKTMSILLIVSRVRAVSVPIHRWEKRDLNSMDKNKRFGGYLRLPVDQFSGIPMFV